MRRRRAERNARTQAAVLARTAQLEMNLGVGSWQDTLAQMNSLLDRLQAAGKAHRSAEDELLDQLRQHTGRLEAALHRREDEYDQLQERFCQLKDEMNARNA
jgi:predicted nuclease with TOPRIM domain